MLQTSRSMLFFRGLRADWLLNFRWSFYSHVWVESVPKNFGWKVCWLGEKKGKDLLNCKYEATFQSDGCAKCTCAATCFIHFCLDHRLDNIRFLKWTLMVFYLFVYLLFCLWVSLECICKLEGISVYNIGDCRRLSGSLRKYDGQTKRTGSLQRNLKTFN